MVAAKHDDAATRIEDLAPTQPTEVDGGEGTPHVLLILADAAKHAQTLAWLNTRTADVLRAVASDVEVTDSAAASGLRLSATESGGGGS